MAQLRRIGHPGIVDVRGKGLLIGVDVDPAFASARLVCEMLMDEGLLSKDTHDTVVRFAPPLVIEREQLDVAIAAVKRVLQALDARQRHRQPQEAVEA
jgi:ornithine--oxo-acid transaminase